MFRDPERVSWMQNHSIGYKTCLQKNGSYDLSEHVTNENPFRPSTLIAPIVQAGGLEKADRRKEAPESELENEGADVPKVPGKVYTPSPEDWCSLCVQAKNRNGANKHVPAIAIDYTCMNETTDDTNDPILVTHNSCSEGVWAVFNKKKGDSAYMKKANSIRGFGYSIKSDQKPVIRC